MGKLIVTTGRKETAENLRMAHDAAALLDCQYIRRGQESLEALKEAAGAEAVLVAKKQQFILRTTEGDLFFHPGMAHLRIKNLHLGISDNLLEAMDLKKGMKVIDCTMGMGADAIVESYAVGAEGMVTALEVSPVTAFVIGYGMQHLTAENFDIHAAMRRVRVINTDYLSFLRRQPDKSADVVYFDPMFRHPIESSAALRPLRTVSDHSAVSPEAVAEARRVARHRVVLKENSRSLEFARLGFTEIAGGKYSRVHYGVIRIFE